MRATGERDQDRAASTAIAATSMKSWLGQNGCVLRSSCSSLGERRRRDAVLPEQGEVRAEERRERRSAARTRAAR